MRYLDDFIKKENDDDDDDEEKHLQLRSALNTPNSKFAPLKESIPALRHRSSYPLQD